MACERVAHYLALIQVLSKMHICVGAWLASISLVPIGKVDTHTVYIHYTELYLVFLLPVSFKISSKLIFSKWNLFLNFKNVARVLVKIPMYNYNAIQTHKFTIKYKKTDVPLPISQMPLLWREPDRASLVHKFMKRSFYL